jgi:hypothetical protein
LPDETRTAIPKLEELNLLEGAPANYDRSKLPWLMLIKDATYCYQCFGLGNAITPQEFWEAYCYLFRARSYDPDSWGDRTRKVVYYSKKRATKSKKLSDNEMKLLCFDVHYELSGLAEFCKLPEFLDKMKRKRKALVEDYCDELYGFIANKQRRCKKAGRGQQLELGLPLPEIERTMTEPSSGYDVAKLFYDRTGMSRPAKLKWKAKNKWARSFRRRAA